MGLSKEPLVGVCGECNQIGRDLGGVGSTAKLVGTLPKISLRMKLGDGYCNQMPNWLLRKRRRTVSYIMSRERSS